MKLYINEISVLVLIIFYLPIVIWALRKIWASHLHGLTKLFAMFSAYVMAYLIPLGDVTYNSIAMAKLCPIAGMRIYKTVKVEGYLTDLGDGDILKKYPYQYIETKTYQTKPDRSLYYRKYEKQSDGTITSRLIDQPTAEYEVRRRGLRYDQTIHAEKASWVIENRITKEIIAEWLFFRALPGWLDRVLVYRWFGYGGSALSCTSRSDFSSWEQKVLLPKNI